MGEGPILDILGRKEWVLHPPDARRHKYLSHAAMDCGSNKSVPVRKATVESLAYLPRGIYSSCSNVKDPGKRVKITKAVDSVRTLKIP